MYDRHFTNNKEFLDITLIINDMKPFKEMKPLVFRGREIFSGWYDDYDDKDESALCVIYELETPVNNVNYISHHVDYIEKYSSKIILHSNFNILYNRMDKYISEPAYTRLGIMLGVVETQELNDDFVDEYI